MNVDPRQNDPQFQSPLVGDSQQASQFGMGGQADVPSERGGTPGPVQGTTPGIGNFDPNTIRPGTDVFGTDGKRVGTVQEVYDDSFLVQKGIFFVHDYFIPFTVVTQVAADRIDLGLTADEAKNQDWAHRPGLASIGRGVQADSTTDTQQSDLNTQNNVNPSGFGASAGTASMNPNQSAGTVMTNQAPNSQMAMPTEAGLNPTGSMPTDDGVRQYDQTANTDPRAAENEPNPSRLVPANQEEGVQPLQGGFSGGAPNDAGRLASGASGAGGMSADPARAGLHSGDQSAAGTVGANPYASPALSPDATGGMGSKADTMNPGEGTSGQGYSGGATPEHLGGNQGNLPGRGTEGASLSGQNTGDEQTYVAGESPAYGTQPSANTPMQQRMPASGAQGRTGSAVAMQRAAERGMQGTNSPTSDTLSGNPKDPRNPDEWDPSEQGMSNP